MRILIVDDFPDTREYLHLALESLGAIDEAANGETALQLFQKALEQDQPYDFVLLDVLMPGISGLEVLERIRALESKYGIARMCGAKVVIATAVDSPEDTWQAFSQQCEAYLMKPYSISQLTEVLRSLGFNFAVTG